MARPKKQPEDLREERINPRLTMAERILIEQNAAALSLTASEYMRRRALSHRMPAPRPEQRNLARAVAELNRLGVNLNQIARHMNAGRAPPPHLSTLLERIDATIASLIDDAGHSGQGPVV